MSRPRLTSSQQPNICSFHWHPLQISRIGAFDFSPELHYLIRRTAVFDALDTLLQSYMSWQVAERARKERKMI